VGVAGLGVGFLSGAASATGLALGLGGILLAFASLTTNAAGLKSLVNALTAWDQVGPLFQSATRHQPLTPAALEQMSLAWGAPRLAAEPVVRVRKVSYRYTEQAPHVLANVDCDIFAHDRILLQGPSGGGKTTLAAVLAGLRQPDAGMIFTRGLNRQSGLSDALPRRVAMAPQFHENHIFTAPLIFNLLIGRRWPPTAQDIADAEDLCEELGLGDLLKRLPGGINQLVGEGGWQLSHGERSRAFIARALLQAADLLILDESFGALDPENLKRALETTLRRAPALMVIAHP
jgi:ATP-binding cassette subfamily B protein